MDRPDACLSSACGTRARPFVTTSYHWNEVCSCARRYRRPVVEIRLNPRFFDPLLARGVVGLLTADRAFANGFRAALATQETGQSPALLTVDADDPAKVRDVLAQADTILVSPLYLDRIPAWRAQSRTEIVPLGHMIARESLDMMEASLVAADRTPSA